MTTRSERMVQAAPGYYYQSVIYAQVQQAVADDLDTQDTNADDIQLQLYIPTATWGLRYWEEKLGIPIKVTDSYDIRRSRVAAKWRGIGNFGADLIKSVCEVFINAEVDVRMRIPEFEIVVTFVGKNGIPPNLEDLQAQVEEIVHAHLGIQWKFRYLIWDELDAFLWPWNTLDANALSWDAIEVYRI